MSELVKKIRELAKEKGFMISNDEAELASYNLIGFFELLKTINNRLLKQSAPIKDQPVPPILQNHNDKASQRYYTIGQFASKYPFTSNGGLRHLIFYEKTNGFYKVVKRIGRKVLIDEVAYFNWIEENNKK